MSTRDELKGLVSKIEGIQALMIAYVTNGRTDTQPAEYQELYYQLDVDFVELGCTNPNQHKSLEAFWSFCKLKEMNDYASRRTYVRELYADILLDIERALRQAKGSGNHLQIKLGSNVNESVKLSSVAYKANGEIVEAPDNIEKLLSILILGLPRAMYPLRNRRKDAPCSIQFNNEYDVQDLLHTLLQPWIRDIRPEEYTPSYAGSSTRIDFVLAEHNIVVEVKYVRDQTHAKKIGDELIIDIARYRTHPQCKQLWIVVYDSSRLIKNPDGLKLDLEKHSESIRVRTYILH
ncbi:MAG: hypothetical protein WHX52_16765 [Anaerolineae bacterium]